MERIDLGFGASVKAEVEVGGRGLGGNHVYVREARLPVVLVKLRDTEWFKNYLGETDAFRESARSHVDVVNDGASPVPLLPGHAWSLADSSRREGPASAVPVLLLCLSSRHRRRVFK